MTSIDMRLVCEGARSKYHKRYGEEATITDNEIEDLLEVHLSCCSLLIAMHARSQSNSQSIQQAQISYAGY